MKKHEKRKEIHMYFIHGKTLWLYETNNDYATLKGMFQGEEWNGTPQDYAREHGLQLNKPMLLVKSAYLGWNWEGEYAAFNTSQIENELLPISYHEYMFFKELKTETDDIDGVEELMKQFLTLKYPDMYANQVIKKVL